MSLSVNVLIFGGPITIVRVVFDVRWVAQPREADKGGIFRTHFEWPWDVSDDEDNICPMIISIIITIIIVISANIVIVVVLLLQ